jgi:bisphosphoglycerate-dependent phosphoglycerate mutase
MWKDDIVEEVRDARRKIGAEHDHNLRRLVKDLRRMQLTSGRKVVKLEPRPPRLLMRASRASGK